ncbi:unnamed protein product [Rotaria sordida]|uniref:Uncharacterized protein n=1 Tax=Rotaria sordida TaxID=392033 RepID=A0A818LNJ3_9BILA|nr:unnamed protein product [Rotaria sordida]CAF3580686.1 unnamed protein product [Rotaria sordida]CAF3580821.1 unnamed protein product [Rotaria sordida]
MNSIQRRLKNLNPVPPIHTIETTPPSPPPPPQSTTVIDPRSPSANIARTPVDLQTYHLPTAPKMNIK